METPRIDTFVFALILRCMIPFLHLLLVVLGNHHTLSYKGEILRPKLGVLGQGENPGYLNAFS